LALQLRVFLNGGNDNQVSSAVTQDSSVATMDIAPFHATSIDDLPPPDTKRWVIRRKAEVVAAVRTGLISLDEACRRYTLSIEEFLSWQRLIDSHGLAGLRVTRLQDYRSLDRAR
jgi:hypothetical protein